MKPITEDIVKTLLDHLDAHKGGQHLSVRYVAEEPGLMTARILPFRQGQGGREPGDRTGAVLDLLQARKARAAARTVSGMFIYAARL